MLIFFSDTCADSQELAERADKALSVIGKPLIGKITKKENGAPLCSNWNMSITHTDGIILLALSSKPVGIDIEREDREVPSSMVDIKNWTAYEAYRKMTGEGIKLSEVREGGDYTREAEFHYFIDGYILAVAGGEGALFTICV